jgi:lipid-binding SYLF domain-containing protein
MKASHLMAAALVSFISVAVGCRPEPPAGAAQQRSLRDDVRAAISKMQARDPDLRDFLDNAEGYAVLPSVGKGGVIVGGAVGRGEVYQRGNFIGYVALQQATVGAQVGGQEYTELIVFQTPEALDRFTSGKLDFAANASAVLLKAGAAKSARFQHGVVVFTVPTGGLMAEAAIGGQKFTFQPGERNSEARSTTQP